MSIDADGHRSDILGTLREALSGPLAGGAKTDFLSLNGSGQVTIEAGLWEPLVLISNAEAIEGEALTVTGSVDGSELPQITYAPWTEEAAFMPLYLPEVGASRSSTTAKTLTIRAKVGTSNIPVNQLQHRLRIQLLLGTFGRLYYVLQSEQIRIRRLIRQVSRARMLSHPGAAEGAMLDRIGQEMAVPRFSDKIAVDSGNIVTEEEREADADYRQRLKIYRTFNMPSSSHVAQRLNAGRPSGDPKYLIEEEDNPFLIALRLVSIGDTPAASTGRRHTYQRYLRDSLLLDPTVPVPAERRIPQERRGQENLVRTRLAAFMSFAGASRSMAPALANTFDRLGIAADALGVNLPVNVLRAQEDDGGSRWELGLSAEISKPTQSKLNEFADKARSIDLSSITDRNARSVASAFKASAPAGAGTTKWLFEEAGFRTVHATATNRIMLSHFSTEGLVIEGSGDLQGAGRVSGDFTASILSENDEATNAALSFALAGGESGWPAGDPPWSEVADGDVAAELAALDAPFSSLNNRQRALGLSTDFHSDRFREMLTRYPPEVFSLLRFDTAFSTSIAAGQAAAWNRLRDLLNSLASNGVASAVLRVGSGARITLVVSVVGLPFSTRNLAPGLSSGFVWRLMPIVDNNYRVRGRGSSATFRGAHGLAALTVVGYARRGHTDPFEYRVSAADGETLTIQEYEFLMNQLRHLTPAGIQANTWDIRRQSVVTDPAAGPTPLPTSLTRAFRPFRRTRFTGTEAPPVSSDS